MILDALRRRPRLLAAIAAGVVVGLLAPATGTPFTRALVGWNAGVWLYLLLDALMMSDADHADLRRVVAANAEGAKAVLTVVVCAAFASLAAIVLELAAAKTPGQGHALPHVALALATVAGSWLLVAVLFTLNYASLYYRDAVPDGPGQGLLFPADGAISPKPDYVDFLYFSFTVAVASQTSDVAVTTQPMRKLVLLQSVLAFVFNTTILALTINIAAGLF